MFSSAKMRRVLVVMLLAAGAIAGFAATTHAGFAATTHAGAGSDQATCLPFRPGCDM